MNPLWGLALALAVAVADWSALKHTWRWLDYLAKPGMMVVLLVTLLLSAPAPMGRPWFALALFFSLLGDVFLMLPQEQFSAGLLSFLLAHLAYIVGFARQFPSRWDGLALMTLLIVGMTALPGRRILSALSSRGESRLRLPVGIYMGGLAGMVLAAWSTWVQPAWPPRASVLVGIGALLFLASDALLAWNRFVHPVRTARLKVRVLYHIGQILLVAGILLAG